MKNDNMHVYCPKCGSEVMLADEKGHVIEPKEGDFFLRLKDNDPEKTKKLKDVIKAMFGDDVNVTGIKQEFAKDPEEETLIPNPFKDSEKEDDEIEKSIMKDGDINSKFLWRRWIMSQVLRHYKTADGKENFHNYFINGQTMNYVFKTCINEAKAVDNSQGIDRKEREWFFNMDVFKDTMLHYLKELEREIDKQLKKLDMANREIVYKQGFYASKIDFIRVGDKRIRENDVAALSKTISKYRFMLINCEDYSHMHLLMQEMRHKLPIIKDCKKCKAWINAFKGAGAFYTLDNLFRWHKCTIDVDGEIYSGDKALKYLRDKTKELPHNEYYKLYAIMKRVIEENNFDFNKRMNDIRNNEVA